METSVEVRVSGIEYVTLIHHSVQTDTIQRSVNDLGIQVSDVGYG